MPLSFFQKPFALSVPMFHFHMHTTPSNIYLSTVHSLGSRPTDNFAVLLNSLVVIGYIDQQLNCLTASKHILSPILQNTYCKPQTMNKIIFKLLTNDKFSIHVSTINIRCRYFLHHRLLLCSLHHSLTILCQFCHRALLQVIITTISIC